jgi:hypothetical protein
MNWSSGPVEGRDNLKDGQAPDVFRLAPNGGFGAGLGYGTEAGTGSLAGTSGSCLRTRKAITSSNSSRAMPPRM